MENNRLLGSLGSLFNALPEGIKLYGNQVVIDLEAFLPEREHRRLLSLVKSVGIRTEEGTIILDPPGMLFDVIALYAEAAA